MPRKPSERPLAVKNIRLFEGDYEEMDKLFPKLKAGPAIRLLVSNFIERNKAAAAPLDIDISIDVLDEVLS